MASYHVEGIETAHGDFIHGLTCTSEFRAILGEGGGCDWDEGGG